MLAIDAIHRIIRVNTDNGLLSPLSDDWAQFGRSSGAVRALFGTVVDTHCYPESSVGTQSLWTLFRLFLKPFQNHYRRVEAMEATVKRTQTH